MKKAISAVLILILAVSLCACGGNPEQPAEASVTATPAPTPVPTPEPTPVPKGDIITFEGKDLDTYIIDGIQCLRVEDAAALLGCETDGSGTFIWRNEQKHFESEYVEVYEFCSEMKIGTLFDEEYNHLYCTAAAGEWELPQGYDVPVFMYHAVGPGSPDANLFMKPSEMEKQLRYLTENGYTTVWFEDLWHVQEIQKPVILVFDDGWMNNYTELFPLLKKYNCKATIALVPDYIDKSHSHLTTDMILEMNESGLVRFESHTMTHDYLYDLTPDEQLWQLTQSRLEITRLTGIEPITLVYPSGTNTDYVRNELINEQHIYRFGVMMVGLRSYNTQDDPAKVYRFWPERKTPLYDYASWLTSTFGPDEKDWTYFE